MPDPAESPKDPAVLTALPVDAETSELDAILGDEDPAFAESLNSITKSTILSQGNLDLDEFLKVTGKEAKGLKKILFMLPGGIWSYFFVKSIPRRIVAFGNWILDSWWILGKYLFTQGPKDLLKFIKLVIGTVFGTLGKGIGSVTGLSGHKKKSLVVILLLVAGLIAVFKYNSKISTFFSGKEPFIGSFEEVAQAKFTYDSALKGESFYNSLRFSGNAYRVKQMVVNLKQTSGHGHPMALFQIVVEGNSQDVIVELKDRESEMSDTIQRTTEDFTFEELESTDGKKALLLQIKQALNPRLTTGQVRRAYFQSIILKP